MEEEKDVTVIEDARTGEIIPIEDIPAAKSSNTLATSLDLTKIGTLTLDEKAEAVLSEPLDPNDVQIRPDGLVYLSWTWYAEKLNRAFGRLQWGLVPQSGPQSKDMGSAVLVVWGHWLIVRGIPVGYEIGETAYRPDNLKMSFGDAAAGAKSNSLARNCKMLGMSLQLWNQEWVSEWRKKHAETYEDKGKTYWRKRANGHKSQNVEKPTEPAKSEEVKATPVGEQGEEKLKVSKLRTLDMVKKIGAKAHKKDSEVAAAINGLDQKGSYSISDVVKILNGEQNAQS